MKTIYAKKKLSQFNELLDYVDDDTVEEIDKYNTNDIENVDYSALEQGEVPVEDSNVDSILVDNIEGEIEQEQPLTEEDVQQETTLEDVPDSSEVGVEDAMNWAIENNRVVKIFYTTKGERRGRGGKQYLKREKGLTRYPKGGVNIYRIVEPHYIFNAKNGNRLLVTYDRSVRHIRAFILSNITDYSFTRNRVSKEPQHFNKRQRIMPKSEKGIKIMKEKNKIMKVAKEIEEKGMKNTASIVRDAYKSLETLKIAQYVGIQGYWIRNRRCWDNCYRQKRTTEPAKAAQEVWMDCWDEYKKSINDNNSGWEKYAKEDKNFKLSSQKEKQWDKYFAEKISQREKEGLSTPEAVYATIEEESKIYQEKVIDSSYKLMELAEALNDGGMKDLGERLAEISSSMLKEADFLASSDVEKEAGIWQGIKNVGKGVGQGIADMWNGGKAPEKEQETMRQRLRSFIQQISQIAQKIRNNIAYIQRSKTSSSSRKIVIEAGKGSRVVKESQDARIDDARMRSLKPKATVKSDGTVVPEEITTAPPAEEEAAAAAAEVPVDNNKNGVNDRQEQPQPASQASVGTIKKINELMTEADNISFWINNEAILEPQEKGMASNVVKSLQQAATSIRKHLTSGDSNNESVAELLEKMVQDVTKALELVEQPASESLKDTPEAQIAEQPGVQPETQTEVQPNQENILGYQGQPKSQTGVKKNIIDLDNLDSYDEPMLYLAKGKIESKIQELKKTKKVPASSNSKLKLVK